jgi:hypothetical protein
MRIPLAGWVAPFGNPGIADRAHLPRAFRSVLRPSSPLSAKASTRCPSHALPTPNGKNPSGLGSQAPGAGIAPAPHLAPAMRAANSSLFRRHFVAGSRPRPPAVTDRTNARSSPATVTQLASLRLPSATPPSPASGSAGGNPSSAAAHPAGAGGTLVEVTGLEPAPSCLQSRRSSQLSYTPGVAKQHRRDRPNRRFGRRRGAASGSALGDARFAVSPRRFLAEAPVAAALPPGSAGGGPGRI